MSQSRRKTCRFFYKPGGCRNGQRCPDEHYRFENGRTNGPPSSGALPHGQKVSAAPRGKCNFYWSTGSCKWAFQCKFEHALSPTVSQGRKDIGDSDGDITSRITSAPFLTLPGLSDMAISGGDVFRGSSNVFNPQETQNYLSTFLRETFRFRSPEQMCSFAKLLASASSMNKSWTDDDGQLFLVAIASGGGCLRLSAILSYEEVSSTSHYDPKVLSFQRGYLPIFQYLSSKFVVKSTLGHLVNSLYTILHNNLGQVLLNLDRCISAYMTARSFKEKPSSPESSGTVLFGPIVTTLYEYLSRFKTALASHKDLGPFISKLGQWIEEWANDICSPNPTFNDLLTTPKQQHARDVVSGHIKDRMHRIASIVGREQAEIDRSTARKAARDADAVSRADETHLLRTLENFYDGPGEERRDGPRHDNDFLNIRAIKVAPTDEELTCKVVPFLPANLPNAPHPFPKDSMQRLLDIQFRLLREELLAPLRTSVQVLLEDMKAPSSRKTQLDELRRQKGGRYNYQDHNDSVMFNVYTGVNFSKIEMDTRRGLVVELQLDSPPGSARSNNANMRASYWANGKRLMQGGLVAVLWRRSDHVNVHLGILCSSSENLAEAARANDNKLLIRIQFFDAIVNFTVLDHMRNRNKAKEERLLVESSVMFETIRPFLESLKRLPESIPFERYLPHPTSGSLSSIRVHPPVYSTAPNFTFSVESLRRAEGDDSLHGVRLITTDPASIEDTRVILKARSLLDPSQADAIVDALTKEIALIQGPPGTGKTFIGVELIRVLIQNKVGPILLIAFTNHALDHMLTSIINNGITTNLVRLGGRSTDDTIKNYSIEELERSSGRSLLDQAIKSEHGAIKETEEEIMKLLGRVIGSNVPGRVLVDNISMLYPDHIGFLENPPAWIRELHSMQGYSDGWEETNRYGKRSGVDTSLYNFWKAAGDLKFVRDALTQKNMLGSPSLAANRFSALLEFADRSLERRNPPSPFCKDESSVSDVDDATSDALGEGTPISEHSYGPPELTVAETFLLAHGMTEVPRESTSDRSLEELLEGDNYNVWNYSESERSRLDSFWVTRYKEFTFEAQKRRFEELVQRHADLRQMQNNRHEQIRLGIVRNRKLVGCTTTGAAKLMSLLKGFSPRVLIVEEAGQVLESHVLASLVDSVEHLVLIGDPLQLRPTLNNYALSIDSPRGKAVYRFDMSLMERLSKTGFPMSRLDVQRRMRQSISSLIRNSLYPKLEDHPCVLQYKSVRGMDKDVFFLTHGNHEHGGGDDSVSKHNPYEVSMVKDLVKYLLRQGPYSDEGSIVVLCTYLGQLARVRDALRGEMTVVIDERDQEALAQHEGEVTIDNMTTIERVNVTQRVRVRSVDNYQGEEADIVILSLVRNSGGGHENNEYDNITRRNVPNIGFLKSENRTNVALSRARLGLYILGNALDFASRSAVWSSVITQLEKEGAVGEAMPVRCHRHPDEVKYVSNPGELPKISPDGGCLRSCNERLSCGHSCPYKCHPDDEKHRSIFCSQPCPKLCQKGHPCSKQCAEPCGNCKHPIRDVELPCGHVHKSVPCHQMDDLSSVKCMVKVERRLPLCEHSVRLPCNLKVEDHKCQAPCDGILPCCGKSCKAKCHVCQEPIVGPAALGALPRTRHFAHECGRPLYCEHACRGICAIDHKCLDECQETCRQKCVHAQCRLPCSKPCAPCQEPCIWSCPHHACPVPCGSVCARLPCDLRCEKLLSCGHRCPSVCGEDCAEQICLECTPRENLTAIADFIMQRPLHDLDPSQGTIDELIITLPVCKHAFTVETLDGHCQMEEYYDRDGSGRWLRLKTPKAGFKKPPTCPTCRHAIRAPRYGRVYKRADLDILERNVASQLIRSIRAAASEFSSLDKTNLRHTFKNGRTRDFYITSIHQEEKREDRENARSKVLKSEDELPVAWNALDPGKYLHGMRPDIAQRWSKDTRRIKGLYTRALPIASARSAHLKAWESAFSSLYRQEIENAIQEPASAPRYPTEHAMRMARMKIGLPPPLADRRFCVEAFWLTIEMRFLLANIAQEWLEPDHFYPSSFSSFKVVWSSFITFILKTCERDAAIALHIAETSQSRKQALRSRVLMFSTKLEILKFDLQSLRNAAGTLTREVLVDNVRAELKELDTVIDEEKSNYRRLRDTGMVIAGTTFKEVFLGPMSDIREHMTVLEEAIQKDTPLSYDEKRQVLAVLLTDYDLKYSGHFYQCPNGHPYVIGDCGGASITSRCPECYELIGGSDHSLLATNRRDTELEEIARAQGVQQSPWPWAR